MVSQVAGDGIGGGRQQAFPLYFKMAYGRSVAAARVVALGSFNHWRDAAKTEQDQCSRIFVFSGGANHGCGFRI